MSNKFEDFLNEQLKDPKVKKEYDALDIHWSVKFLNKTLVVTV